MNLPLWGTVAAGVLLVGAGLVAALVNGTDAPMPLSAALPTSPAEPASDAVQLALRDGKPTVAEFGANACAACREMKPLLETLQREHGARIAVVNVDLTRQKEVNYIQHHHIQLMPTQIFFDAQGREIGRNLGKITGPEILARLQVQGGAAQAAALAVPAPSAAIASPTAPGATL